MTDRACSHMASCAMYSLFTLSGTLKTWQSRYCQAEFRECARFKLSLEGKSVPINLMPNGALLRQAPKRPPSG